MEAFHILIVEDDKEIREGIEIYLKNQGYSVSQAADGIEGLEKIEKEEIHLAIVDIMMPRMDGITMMMKVRERGYDFPVIMLSAKSEEVDKIMGLNMGADDYVTKPFNPLELTARVKSQLRRFQELNPGAGGARADNCLCVRGLEINKNNHQVMVYGEEVKLTPIEFDILYLLASNPGRVFSTDEIFEKVWNEKVYEANNTVMVHIRRLRSKMREDTRQDKIITTVWGVGYKIEK